MVRYLTVAKRTTGRSPSLSPNPELQVSVLSLHILFIFTLCFTWQRENHCIREEACTAQPAAAMRWPLTCCSRLRITATAWCRTSSLVCGFSLFRCSWHMWPSSLKASLMSRTRRRSRALLAILLSRSRSAFCSGLRSSSSWILQHQQGVRKRWWGYNLWTESFMFLNLIKWTVLSYTVDFSALCWSLSWTHVVRVWCYLIHPHLFCETLHSTLTTSSRDQVHILNNYDNIFFNKHILNFNCVPFSLNEKPKQTNNQKCPVVKSLLEGQHIRQHRYPSTRL